MNQLDWKRGPKITEIEHVPIPEVHQFRLANGIEVYEVGGALQEVIKLEIVFKTGRPYEPQKMLSKAVSYMLKEGSSEKSSVQIAEFFDFYGASFKTITNLDDCRIILFCLKKFFAKVLPVVVRLIVDSQFPQHELDNYIENSIQNLKLDLSKDEFIAYRELTEKIFGADHPYGYNSTEDLYRTLRRTNIQQYHNKVYGSANCTLFLSGNTDEEIRHCLGEHFSTMCAKHKTEATFPEVIPLQGTWQMHSKNMHQTAIRIGKRLFNRSHPDYAAMFFLTTLLGGYFGSRLMSNLREDKGYTYSIYAGLDDFVYDGYFYISADVGNEFVTNAMDEIRKELTLLQKEPIHDDEVKLVKNYLVGSFLNSLDGPLNQVQLVRSFQSKTGDWQNFKHFIDQIKQMNAEKLMRVASTYMDPGSMISVLVGAKTG